MDAPDEQVMEQDDPMTGLANLTASERRVLDEALLGLTIHEIAARLFLSEATVKTHLTHVYDKLGVRGRVDLMARLRSDPKTPPAAQSESTHNDSPRRRGRFPAWILPAGVVAVASLILVVAALVTLSNRAQPITFDELSSFVEQGMIAQIRSAGDVITATAEDGREYELSGERRTEVRGLAVRNGISYGEASAAPAPAALVLLVSLAPYGLVLGLAWLAMVLARSRRSADATAP